MTFMIKKDFQFLHTAQNVDEIEETTLEIKKSFLKEHVTNVAQTSQVHMRKTANS